MISPLPPLASDLPEDQRRFLLGILADWLRQSPLPASVPQPPPVGPHANAPGRILTQLLPRITVVEQRVYCNGAILDLSRRPLTARLFAAFCAAPDYQISRSDLLRQVYRVSDLGSRSRRYTEATHNNGVKLISRARLLAAKHLSPAVRHGIEWFVYDQERKIWCLYRLRHEYLSEHLS